MDDVTIEDEVEFEHDLSSSPKTETSVFQWSSIFQIITQQWTIFLLLSIGVAIFLYINEQRKRNKSVAIDRDHLNGETNSVHKVDRYEAMEFARQRQQKAYEEQARLQAERKKAKLEALKTTTTDENPSRLKYRSNDYNPLTGQSNRGSGDSCSWRPSSSRRKPAGG